MVDLSKFRGFYANIASWGNANDGPPLTRSPRREEYIREIVHRPRLQSLRANRGDFRHLARDIEAREGKRICVRCDGIANPYVAGVQNGRTAPVESNPDVQPIRNLSVYWRATV